MPSSNQVRTQRIEHLQELIRILTRRLQDREIQFARYGIDVPPHISAEIDDMKIRIAEHQAEIDQLNNISRRIVWFIGGGVFVVISLIAIGIISSYASNTTEGTRRAVTAVRPDNSTIPTPTAEDVSFLSDAVSTRKHISLAPGTPVRYRLYIFANQILTVTNVSDTTNTESDAMISITDAGETLLGSGKNKASAPTSQEGYYFVTISGNGLYDIEISIPALP